MIINERFVTSIIALYWTRGVDVNAFCAVTERRHVIQGREVSVLSHYLAQARARVLRRGGASPPAPPLPLPGPASSPPNRQPALRNPSI
jgi:hypothetical protein